eukprot:COSAG01_NODE_205_length_22070_cov_106.423877_5_plen_362_part_00
MLPFSAVAAEPTQSVLPGRLAALLACPALAATELGALPPPTPSLPTTRGVAAGAAAAAAGGGAPVVGGGAEALNAQAAAAAAAAAEVGAAAQAAAAQAAGVQRAAASVHAAVDSEGPPLKMMQRIKHNGALGGALLRLHGRAAEGRLRRLLRWEDPCTSWGVLLTLQWLVLTDRAAYLPALATLALAAHVRSTVQQQQQQHGSAAEPLPVVYHFQDDSILQKKRRLQSGISRLDELVQRHLVMLLKLHSAVTAVDGALSSSFATGLACVALVLSLMPALLSLVPWWLVLSAVLSWGFSAEHPAALLARPPAPPRTAAAEEEEEEEPPAARPLWAWVQEAAVDDSSGVLGRAYALVVPLLLL